jgi:tRNA (cmo5U34)-methyltransferase
MTLHHLLPTDKLKLYRKIRRMLKPGGSYIEGDFVVSPSQETRLSFEYQQLGIDVSSLNGDYHLDIPMSVPTLRTLLKRAGFTMTEIIYQQGEAVVLKAG